MLNVSFSIMLLSSAPLVLIFMLVSFSFCVAPENVIEGRGERWGGGRGAEGLMTCSNWEDSSSTLSFS